MILVVMAAGMGSRFGGLKQLTPVGPNQEFLIDYSIYDAILAGVKKVVFVIKEEHLEMFRETLGKRLESKVKVEYAFQKMDDVPLEQFKKIQRTKPWGTGQALLASAPYVDDVFMIINADDFYGRDAFQVLGTYLKDLDWKNTQKKEYGMVSYLLKNTLSVNGTVSRGICEVSAGYLKQITEKTKLGYKENQVISYEEDKEVIIDENTPISVNLFGFTPDIFEDADKYFKEFLMSNVDLTTKEFYLPSIVQESIDKKIAKIKVLNTTSKFNGMTYRDDLEGVKEEIKNLIKNGIYPEKLWEDESNEE